MVRLKQLGDFSEIIRNFRGLNSTMVRLKHKNPKIKVKIPLSLNSTMVRLKLWCDASGELADVCLNSTMVRLKLKLKVALEMA